MKVPSLLIVSLPAALLLAGCLELNYNDGRIDIASGEAVSGDLATRNGAIRIREAALVEGALETRNGAIAIESEAHTGKVASRNGAIRLGERVETGSIETRNGAIVTGDGSRIRGSVETRNGSIRLGREVLIDGSVHTRNGSIELAESTHATGDVLTRNGGVQLREGVRVDGNVTSRNGSLRLTSASVGGHVDVNAGSIDLGGTTEVEQDVILLMDAGWAPERGSRIPTVRIGPEVVIVGRLIVDERANLEIDPDARVPEVERLANRGAM